MADVVFMNLKAADPEAAARLNALREGSRNWGAGDIEIECRFDADSDELRRKNAHALVKSGVKVIQASSGPALEALQDANKTGDVPIPIMFARVTDPVATKRVKRGSVASILPWAFTCCPTQ